MDWRQGKTWEEIFGVERAAELREATRNRLKRLWRTSEYRSKLLTARIGLKRSEETKRKIRNWNKGKSVSVETRLKISKARAGKKLSEKHKAHIRESTKKAWANPVIRKKLSVAMSGKNNPFYGKHHTEAQKKKWRKTRSCQLKKLWQNPEYREKTIKATLKATHITPNKPERFLINLFKKHKLPYNYVGDGSLLMGGKCPDFVNVNGQKKIIEHFGDYWHNNQKTKQHQTEKGTKEHYRQFGFKTLVIWEYELKNPATLLEKINTFDRGG